MSNSIPSLRLTLAFLFLTPSFHRGLFSHSFTPLIIVLIHSLSEEPLLGVDYRLQNQCSLLYPHTLWLGLRRLSGFIKNWTNVGELICGQVRNQALEPITKWYGIQFVLVM
jgi:hypothetical protein